MKSKHAAAIRVGIRFAKNWREVPYRFRADLYSTFLRKSSYLEWRAFQEYRVRHFTD